LPAIQGFRTDSTPNHSGGHIRKVGRVKRGVEAKTSGDVETMVLVAMMKKFLSSDRQFLPAR
jgi:hypothetical protein